MQEGGLARSRELQKLQAGRPTFSYKQGDVMRKTAWAELPG